MKISSVGELIACVHDMISADNEIRWFRGHASASWNVEPHIWRPETVGDERNFTNRFRTRAAMRRPSSPASDDYSGWLSLMQHYGLPTRLLDWTRSPLIAAYFAVSRYRSSKVAPEDAVIWVLRPHTLNSLEGYENLTYPIDSKSGVEMIQPAFRSTVTENGKVLAVMAVENDLRMFVQQGAFTIHSDRMPLNKREGHSRYLVPLLIKAQYVTQLAWEVHICGIRRGDIFPDLANLADELKGLT